MRMKTRRIPSAVALLLLAACLHRHHNDCSDLNVFMRDAEIRRVVDAHGTLLAIGRGLPRGWDRAVDPWTGADQRERNQPVRVGTWTYLYGDGSKRAEVTYEVSCYIECCSCCPCPQLRDYPAGRFTLWYPSGRKLGEGTFEPEKIHVSTNC